MCISTPKLFSNGGGEDKEALFLLMEASIPFVNIGPTTEDPTPYVEYGHWRFFGLEGVKKFVERWKGGDLPQVDCKV